jgi:hypothetical protein
VEVGESVGICAQSAVSVRLGVGAVVRSGIGVTVDGMTVGFMTGVIIAGLLVLEQDTQKNNSKDVQKI